MATFYPPARGLWLLLRGAWKRLRCHHIVMPDEWGHPHCAKCRSWLM
jgi:hypothetical protein